MISDLSFVVHPGSILRSINSYTAIIDVSRTGNHYHYVAIGVIRPGERALVIERTKEHEVDEVRYCKVLLMESGRTGLISCENREAFENTWHVIYASENEGINCAI